MICSCCPSNEYCEWRKSKENIVQIGLWQWPKSRHQNIVVVVFDGGSGTVRANKRRGFTLLSGVFHFLPKARFLRTVNVARCCCCCCYWCWWIICGVALNRLVDLSRCANGSFVHATTPSPQLDLMIVRGLVNVPISTCNNKYVEQQRWSLRS